jgi:hypothetical protein
MDTTKTAEEINRHRRYFVGAAALTAAAAQLGIIDPAAAHQVRQAPSGCPPSNQGRTRPSAR